MTHAQDPRRIFHAHSLTDRPEAHWQPLADHLQAVAALAARFAEWFGGESLARTAGLLHDLGKYTEEFQRRIRGSEERVDHATWGARVAIERFGALGYLIAYAIAGHHAGLANGEGEGSRTHLRDRLAAELPPLLDAWQRELTLPPAHPEPPARLKSRGREHRNFTLSFLVRMLFSCLVDADFLDTERFYACAENRHVPRGCDIGIDPLQAALSSHLEAKALEADPGWVNTERQRILAHVRAQAGTEPRLFSLTVPTGGGKTLTSLAFALDHAKVHTLRRVICVIPFTSIVEQTASVFRGALGALGDEAVLEHHSAYADDPDKALEAQKKICLAMENWDRPLVVTTAVQFFESLFADRPSQCRKLHRIAGSVIVLDEAQTIPLKLLRPTLLALDELQRNYRCSIVFCTATQPALADDAFRDVIGELHELAPDPAGMFRRFRRVSVRHLHAQSDDEVVARLQRQTQALCIVNNRLHARALFQALGEASGATHLSTLMCAAHRRQVLARARQALKDGQPCRLVSTSLIEAGVDVSFPLVMRAEAGLDSVAQAAGRCNREGLLATEDSDVLLFTPDARWAPPPELTQFAEIGARMLRKHAADPLSPEAIHEYFGEVYWARGKDELDGPKLLKLLSDSKLESLPLDTLARQYRLITQRQETVIVPFDEDAKGLINRLAHADSARGLSRKLQPYTVQVPRKAFLELRQTHAVAPVAPNQWGEQFMRLVNPDLYRDDIGLHWEHPGFLSAADLVQ